MAQKTTLAFSMCIAALAMLAFACGDTSNRSSGQGSACEIPPGAYVSEITNAGGSCSSELVDSVTADTATIAIDQGEACGLRTDSNTKELDNGCEATIIETFRGTATGLADASGSIQLVCPDEGDCIHNFDFSFEKQHTSDDECTEDNDCLVDERCNLDTGECAFACSVPEDCLSDEACVSGAAASGGVCMPSS